MIEKTGTPGISRNQMLSHSPPIHHPQFIIHHSSFIIHHSSFSTPLPFALSQQLHQLGGEGGLAFEGFGETLHVGAAAAFGFGIEENRLLEPFGEAEQAQADANQDEVNDRQKIFAQNDRHLLVVPDDRIPVADDQSAPLDEEVEVDQRMGNEQKAQDFGLALARRVAFVFGEQPRKMADQHGGPAVVEVARALQRRVDERGHLAQKRRRENGGQKGVAEIIEPERSGQVRQRDGFGLDDDEKQRDSGKRHREGVQLAGVAQAFDHRLGVGPLHRVAGRVEAHERRRVGRGRVEAVDADLATRDAVVARGEIDGAAAQVDAVEPRARQVGSAKIRPAQIRAGELRLDE